MRFGVCQGRQLGLMVATAHILGQDCSVRAHAAQGKHQDGAYGGGKYGYWTPRVQESKHHILMILQYFILISNIDERTVQNLELDPKNKISQLFHSVDEFRPQFEFIILNRRPISTRPAGRSR